MPTRYFAYRRHLKPRARALRREVTPAERRLWYEFLSGLPQKFTRQKPLGQYIVGFYCSSHQLVIEVDGDSHYTDRSEARDAVRTERLDELGVRVLRFTNPEVMQEFETVCEVVLRALDEG